MKIKTTIFLCLTCAVLAAQNDTSSYLEPEKPELVLVYPGFKKSPVLVKVNYSNLSGVNLNGGLELNVDRVELLVSHQGGPYEPIRGPKTFSVSKLAGNPFGFDYFLYSDFVTRIRQDHEPGEMPVWTASCPLNSRYRDGEYRLKGKCVDIYNNSTCSPEETFLLDNFKPYIHRVEMILGGQTVYDSHWECGDFCAGMFFKETVSIPVNPDALNSGLKIIVYSSEPLDELVLDMPYFSLANISPSEISPGRMIHSFFIAPPAGDGYSSDPFLYFEGSDFAGNALLDLSGFVGHSCVTVPVRAADGWVDIDGIPEGKDKIHAIPCPEYKEMPIEDKKKDIYPASSCNSDDDREDGNIGGRPVFSIYPNPAKNYVCVEYSPIQTTVKREFSVVILDGIGRIMDRQLLQGYNGQIRISTMQLPSGVYFLRLFNKKGLLRNQKLIISR